MASLKTLLALRSRCPSEHRCHDIEPVFENALQLRYLANASRAVRDSLIQMGIVQQQEKEEEEEENRLEQEIREASMGARPKYQKL